MTSPILRCSDDWLKQPPYMGIKVLDPDGWDRANLDASWAELIDEVEFNHRLGVSTCSFPAGFFDQFIKKDGQP